MVLKSYSSKQIPIDITKNKDVLAINSWVVWLLMFIFWTLISVVLTIQDIVLADMYPEKYHTSTALTFLLNSFPFFYTWFALTPLIFWFGKKFTIGQGSKSARNLIVHIFLSLCTVAIYLCITSVLSIIFVKGIYELSVITDDVIRRAYSFGHFEVVIYWAILGVGISLNYYRKFREQEREASRLIIHSSQLETQLVKAQLDSLKMQIHPHFLFNTLHAISALIEENPKRSRKMIALLGELLRSTLDISDQHTITLRKEIVLTKLYLKIEQERFRDRLHVKTEISPDLMGCLIPTLILQPLIENAIKHGMKDENENTIIKINVSRANNHLQIFVEDNGPGFYKGETKKLEDGVGLRNTKARLEQLYGEDHEFQASNSEKGGAIVKISIPFDLENNIDESK